MTGELLIDQPRAHVLRLMINRPDRLNAYTSELCVELRGAIDRAATRDEIRVLVITGTGRAFCSGGDVKDEAVLRKAEERQFGHAVVMREGMHTVIEALHEFDKPTIAAVNGVAVAGGLTLALACDFRICSEEARLGDTSGRVGLLPDEGGAWYFPRVLGYPRALRMSLLGEVYDADEALALGLADEVVPDAELPSRALDLAGRLAEAAPLAARAVKTMMRRGADSSLSEALHEARMWVMAVNDSEDVAEGLAAFAERRPPRFRGR
ncbi:enoyl-CoA hydratase/isomerase family protein [Aeromicrobium piscarium]|uniref:Enoyl-CoA hydratase/isomerase family protein n=1 Tax=Aeromicrobium piscarium TaxID=2590901 RepID=A0A554SFK6_9ACTN|nr:enoyl-CoA hydratase-related protein [Aeromicrobium piscarium]TSD65132.1 enoyl-CoA hydratase/isomerase family protein [Aeromicrobium piscarium]